MKSISIIHLSDLHIDSKEDSSFKRVRESLLEDIVDLVKANNININALTITGDIVNKGGNDESFSLAENYLIQLIDKLGLEKDRLLLVPGNHDIPRNSAVSMMLKNANEIDFDDRDKFNEYWDMLVLRFSKFKDFRDIFNEKNSSIECTFGGAIRDIDCMGIKVRFLLFNSSWATTGDNDYRNIRIGRWQLEGFKDKYIDLDRPELTIALTHHPINWMTDEEYELTRSYFKDKIGLNVNVIMHGHVHNGQIERLQDPDSNIISLVSGIGYPEIDKRTKGQPKLANCRYAIYSFDMETGNMETWLRITNNNGKFVADTCLYEVAKEDGHFVMPFINKQLKSNDNTTSMNYIEVDPVPLVSGWSGREEEISSLLNPNIKVAAITGVGGQGKSALAAEFLRRYAREDNTNFKNSIWVDCRELPDSLHSKLIQVMDSLSCGKESVILFRNEKFEETVKRFLRYLQTGKLLIVLDNVDAYVNIDTEYVTSELKIIIDTALNNNHNSLIILTCRPPINDHRNNFKQIQLSGLNINESIEFFRKRNIELKGDNEERYCTGIIKFTKGHPWWLGLIAGQINFQKGSFKNCLKEFNSGDIFSGNRIKEYFQNIWSQLDKNMQRLLRYLIEAPRALCEEEIILAATNYGPVKARKLIGKLLRMGLLEQHEGTMTNLKTYQVHPLVREFVHGTYTITAQRQYVCNILYIFLPKKLVDPLFNNDFDCDKIGNDILRPNNLIDSIETCLNSRNEVQAYKLLKSFKSVLYDEGYHHQYIFLACRIMDSINWEEQMVTKNYQGARLLSNIIDTLSLIGDKSRYLFYLKKYETIVEPGTLHYIGYLNTASHISWQECEFEKSLNYANECSILIEKFGTEWEFYETAYVRALALRDSGQSEIALTIFKNTTDDASKYGNIARCYQKLHCYKDAEEYLKKSLKILLEEKDYVSRTNIGYAYLWISEIMYEQNKMEEAKAFLLLSKENWEEYAPGLLSRTFEIEKVVQNYNNNEKVNISDAKCILKKFLDS